VPLPGGLEEDTSQPFAERRAAGAERAMRRIKQNDLENLPRFLIAGLLFILTSPSPSFAQVLHCG
jgi:hypothetical protein